MEHRIANSLQIIASILLLKAGSVSSEETKNELRAAHQRVMSVAAVQSYLHASDGIEQIEMGPYLKSLVLAWRRQWSDPSRTSILSSWRQRRRSPTSHAVSVGLIVTELIMNAIKYAFPSRAHRRASG